MTFDRKRVKKLVQSLKKTMIINRLPMAAKKTSSSERVQEAYEDVIQRYQKPKKACLNQQREAFNVHNQSSTGKAVKKVVGSVCCEKACDSVIGKRQKHKAMSWSVVGSRSLAILIVNELNNKWGNIWAPKIASNDLQEAANDPCVSGELDLVA